MTQEKDVKPTRPSPAPSLGPLRTLGTVLLQGPRHVLFLVRTQLPFPHPGRSDAWKSFNPLTGRNETPKPERKSQVAVTQEKDVKRTRPSRAPSRGIRWADQPPSSPPPPAPRPPPTSPLFSRIFPRRPEQGIQQGGRAVLSPGQGSSDQHETGSSQRRATRGEQEKGASQQGAEQGARVASRGLSDEGFSRGKDAPSEEGGRASSEEGGRVSYKGTSLIKNSPPPYSRGRDAPAHVPFSHHLPNSLSGEGHSRPLSNALAHEKTPTHGTNFLTHPGDASRQPHAVSPSHYSGDTIRSSYSGLYPQNHGMSQSHYPASSEEGGASSYPARGSEHPGWDGGGDGRGGGGGGNYINLLNQS